MTRSHLERILKDSETLAEVEEKAIHYGQHDPDVTHDMLVKAVKSSAEEMMNKEFRDQPVDHPRYGPGIIEKTYFSQELDEWRIVYRVEESQKTVEVPAEPPLTVAGKVTEITAKITPNVD